MSSPSAAASPSVRPQARCLPLTEHRIRAKVTLEQIAADTRIGRRFLEAIESGNYGELPGGVFTVSYIRQYAEATGYDAELILNHYRRAEPVEEKADRCQASAGASRWRLAFFL